MKIKSCTSANLLISPLRLFGFAQAFRFSSGRGQCFSPGIKGLVCWYARRLRQRLLDRAAFKWWRCWLEKV